jgi:hypothetical protein
MNDEQRPELEQPQSQPQQERSLLRRRRAALGYDGRSERRALRGAARRRKMRTRLWLVATPAVVLIALVVTLLVLFGGPNDMENATTSSTTTVTAKTGGALLVVEQNGAAQVAVVFQAREFGGVVLVIPGMTLVREGDQFLTVAEIYAAGDAGALAEVLGSVFGARAQAAASAPWGTLRSALVSAGLSSVPALLQTQDESRQLASALQALAAGVGLGGLWAGVELQGDASGFRSALEAAAGSGKQWTVAAVAGRLVEGNGFKYVEPEVAVARALLSGTPNDSAITVELQNGSGAVGIVEAAAAQLQPLGYQLTPSGNSEDFPNVVRTRIVFSTDSAGAAARVQALLGVGAMIEDPEAGLDQVIVVLGSDYAPVVDAANETGN